MSAALASHLRSFGSLRLIGRLAFCLGFMTQQGVGTSTPVMNTETICVWAILKGVHKQHSWTLGEVNKSSTGGLHIEMHKNADILAACSKKEEWGYFSLSVFWCQGALSFPSI